MAARRHPSAPVDALDRRVDLNDLGARATAGLTRWVLGTGLLWLHALAFVVVGLGMLLRNILTDPADITVGDPLLRWGIVLAGHAAAIAIGWTVWRVAHPTAARPAYRPVPRTALVAGRRAPLTAEPVWYPDSAMNGHATGPSNGHANGASPDAATNGHVPHPTGAWPTPSRTVVTSRRITTLVVATARDGLASARRRYRRDTRSPAPAQHPNGTNPQQPWAGGASSQQPNGAHPQQAWAGGAPAQPHGALPPANGVHHANVHDEPPATSWSAGFSRDEVISVTQVGADPTQGLGERPAGEAGGTDPVRSWLDGYLDGQGRECEARWTWVEAAASTWLARGDDPRHALPASAPDDSPPTTTTPPPTRAEGPPLDASPPESSASSRAGAARGGDRPLDATSAEPPTTPRGGDRPFNARPAEPSSPTRGGGRLRDAAPDLAADDPSRPPPSAHGSGASPA